MGYGIDFKADIYLSRQNYNESINQVEAAMLECEESIETTKQQMLMLASANIRDILPDDWKEEPVRWLHMQLVEVWNYILDEHNQWVSLTQYKEYLETKDKEDEV